jgi:tellurite resistance protein TerC
LFFVLAGFKDRLVHLNKGLGVILVYVGIKMLLSFWDIHVDIRLSLAFIVLVLAVTVIVSLRATPAVPADRPDEPDAVGGPGDGPAPPAAG